jgi:hypothetical protein
MSPDTFRQLLSNLLQIAAESGLDVFFIHQELSLAGFALVDECLCDLADRDDPEPEPY